MKKIDKFVLVDGYEWQVHFEDGEVKTVAYADQDYNIFEKVVAAAGRDMRIPVTYEDL